MYRGGAEFGAHARIRTGDLFLTKEMLYRLSYMGVAQFDFICYKLGALMPTIDKALATARRRITRVTAEQANAEHAAGALLVDTRTESQRRDQGEIPGALVIDRTVLEWRLDPSSPSRIAEATDHLVRVILVCAQGYSSSLAAASLQDLGLVNATDVIGGFEAWQAAGLPIAKPSP
jgi:rhodanese-related sulfurtransferase